MARHLVVHHAHGALLHSLCHLLVELIDFLGDFLLLGRADLGHNFEAFALESDQFTAKTEASTALRQKPFRGVLSIGLLALDRQSKVLALRILDICFSNRLRALRLEREDVGVAILVESRNLAI